MEALLQAAAASGDEAPRLAATQWAVRLFPFGHVPARYICVLAAGDAKLELREAGAAGLAPPKRREPGMHCCLIPACCSWICTNMAPATLIDDQE